MSDEEILDVGNEGEEVPLSLLQSVYLSATNTPRYRTTETVRDNEGEAQNVFHETRYFSTDVHSDMVMTQEYDDSGSGSDSSFDDPGHLHALTVPEFYGPDGPSSKDPTPTAAVPQYRFEPIHAAPSHGAAGGGTVSGATPRDVSAGTGSAIASDPTSAVGSAAASAAGSDPGGGSADSGASADMGATSSQDGHTYTRSPTLSRQSSNDAVESDTDENLVSAVSQLSTGDSRRSSLKGRRKRSSVSSSQRVSLVPSAGSSGGGSGRRMSVSSFAGGHPPPSAYGHGHGHGHRPTSGHGYRPTSGHGYSSRPMSGHGVNQSHVSSHVSNHPPGHHHHLHHYRPATAPGHSSQYSSPQIPFLHGTPALGAHPGYDIVEESSADADRTLTNRALYQYRRNPLPSSWNRTVTYSQSPTFPTVKKLAMKDKKRIVVTGGAGFVGSHLVDRLMFMGHDVTAIDNFFSGTKTSVAHWIGHPNFELVRADVVEPLMIECDQIYHLACPASPQSYQFNAIKTLKTNFLGTLNMLGLAKRVKARFLLSSTSEIYGSPQEHPQREEYWGYVNSIGPRACYDEGKRVAEALVYGYERQEGVEIRVARIFNSFGPRMNSNDGRLVSNFIVAALKGDDIQIYGSGKQTRSLMYIHDLINGLIALMESDCDKPVNIGSEAEDTVENWAQIVLDTVNDMRAAGRIPPLPLGVAPSKLVYVDAIVDDPPRRRADTTRARSVLRWRPRFTVRKGIEETVMYFSARQEGEI